MALEIKETTIDQVNPFGTAYIHHFDQVKDFFHYPASQQESFQHRIKDLKEQAFERDQLAAVIENYQSQWGLSEKVQNNLSRLKDKNSVVVIGGQQAGLMLGPLYTLHKVITIIQLAKQQEQELNIPVLPVFWIAGEDHDFQEINHVYYPRKEEPYMDRLAIEDPNPNAKVPISQRNLPKDALKRWIEQFFNQHPQTEFTRGIRKRLEHFTYTSHTYVDFFAQTMHDLFADYGLLMIDSGDDSFRSLQRSVFTTIIDQYDLIDEQVRHSMHQIRQRGYQPQVEVGNYPALLFVYENGERLLLEKVKGKFQTKDAKYQFTEDEMIDIAQNKPWKLSNNVLTRPLMQESLFPTLSFVGGPGEIAYWALCKSYFECFYKKLPILSPRINGTFIERPIARIIEKRKIPLECIFAHFDHFKQEWLQAQDHLSIEDMFAKVRDQIKDIYQPLLEDVKKIDRGTEQLGYKNLDKILDQVRYFEKRSHAAFSTQHDAALRQFDRVEQALVPHGRLQERMYNSFTFLNKHGKVLVDQLLSQPLSINGKHKLIYL